MHGVWNGVPRHPWGCAQSVSRFSTFARRHIGDDDATCSAASPCDLDVEVHVLERPQDCEER